MGKESCQSRALPALMGPAAWKSIPRRGKSKPRSSEAGCGPPRPWRAVGEGAGEEDQGARGQQGPHSPSQGFRCYSEMGHQAVTAVDLTRQRVILAPGWPSGWKDMRAAVSLQLLSRGLAPNKHDQAGGSESWPQDSQQGRGGLLPAS